MGYGRKAFGPGRKSSRQALARDIADSILSHRGHGRERKPEQYTNNLKTIAEVNELLEEAQYMAELYADMEAAERMEQEYMEVVETDAF